MTATMTALAASTHNAKAILADLETIIDTMPTMSKADLLSVGTKLNEVIKVARACYVAAPEKECSECGNWLSAIEARGEVCNACLDARSQAKPIERVRCVCSDCGREWVGNDLAAVGTIEYRQCGLCAKGVAKPVAKALPEVTSEHATAGIPDGTYTVVFGDGTERTIKLKTQAADKEFMPGKQIASYLNGPDNWSNYQSFANVNADGTFHVWRKYQNAGTVISALAVLTSGREALVNGLKAYGMASGKCGLCGKKLTRSSSILEGIGPICAGKLGL